MSRVVETIRKNVCTDKFLNLEKASDTVHSKIKSLGECGFRVPVLEWIKFHLSHLTYKVFIKVWIFSEEFASENWISWESFLGPLLVY